MSGTITVEGQLREGSGTNSTNNGGGVSVGLEGGAGGTQRERSRSPTAPIS